MTALCAVVTKRKGNSFFSWLNLLVLTWAQLPAYTTNNTNNFMQSQSTTSEHIAVGCCVLFAPDDDDDVAVVVMERMSSDESIWKSQEQRSEWENERERDRWTMWNVRLWVGKWWMTTLAWPKFLMCDQQWDTVPFVWTNKFNEIKLSWKCFARIRESGALWEEKTERATTATGQYTWIDFTKWSSCCSKGIVQHWNDLLLHLLLLLLWLLWIFCELICDVLSSFAITLSLQWDAMRLHTAHNSSLLSPVRPSVRLSVCIQKFNSHCMLMFSHVFLL